MNQSSIMIEPSSNISTKISIKTNRYTYSEGVIEQLSSFAKVHEYDERKDFKEAWHKWIEEPDIKLLIGEEVSRLTSNGLTGDIYDRMYKSARYYYRKKVKSDEQTVPVVRKEYEGLPREVLRTIDDYICGEINRSILESELEGNKRPIEITAAKSFLSFCKLNYKVISEMLSRTVMDENDNMREEIQKVTNKLKKTYKNRFYNIKVTIGCAGKKRKRMNT